MLPPALVGGAAVGATLGLVFLVLLGYLFSRRHSKKKRQQQQQRHRGFDQGHQLPPMYVHSKDHHQPHRHHVQLDQAAYGYAVYAQPKRDVVGYGYDSGPWQRPPVEVMTRNPEPVELGNGR